MRRFAITLGLAPLVMLWLAGCQMTLATPPAAPPPIPPGGGSPWLSDAEVDSARALYLAKCARCHKFYDPAKYTEAEWRKWMTKMSRKAKLKPEQDDTLRHYLDLYRAVSATNPGP